MRLFSKGSDWRRCPTLCCLYRVLAITLSWTVRKNISDDRGLNRGRQWDTYMVPEPQDTLSHRGNILNKLQLKKGIAMYLINKSYWKVCTGLHSNKLAKWIDIGVNCETKVCLYRIFGLNHYTLRKLSIEILRKKKNKNWYNPKRKKNLENIHIFLMIQRVGRNNKTSTHSLIQCNLPRISLVHADLLSPH